MTQVPLIPDASKTANYKEEQHQFACSETQGLREEQEDALFYEVFKDNELEDLTPTDIGICLFKAYKYLDDEFLRTWNGPDGTTASTTIITEKHIITATVGDACAFAVIYDDDGLVHSVRRINEGIHDLSSLSGEELAQIQENGGFISAQNNIPYSEGVNEPYRISPIHGGGGLNMTRALGDKPFKKVREGDKPLDRWRGKPDLKGDIVRSDADIDILDISTLPKGYTLQIISVCDGFTEPAGKDASSKDQEAFLSKALEQIRERYLDKGRGLSELSEQEMAIQLQEYAFQQGSKDNISVAVQTVLADTRAMLGIYDGHAGNAASDFISKNIGEVFNYQLCCIKSNQVEDSISTAISFETKTKTKTIDIKPKVEDAITFSRHQFRSTLFSCICINGIVNKIIVNDFAAVQAICNALHGGNIYVKNGQYFLEPSDSSLQNWQAFIRTHASIEHHESNDPLVDILISDEQLGQLDLLIAPILAGISSGEEGLGNMNKEQALYINAILNKLALPETIQVTPEGEFFVLKKGLSPENLEKIGDYIKNKQENQAKATSSGTAQAAKSLKPQEPPAKPKLAPPISKTEKLYCKNENEVTTLRSVLKRLDIKLDIKIVSRSGAGYEITFEVKEDVFTQQRVKSIIRNLNFWSFPAVNNTKINYNYYDKLSGNVSSRVGMYKGIRNLLNDYTRGGDNLLGWLSRTGHLNWGRNHIAVIDEIVKEMDANIAKLDGPVSRKPEITMEYLEALLGRIEAQTNKGAGRNPDGSMSKRLTYLRDKFEELEKSLAKGFGPANRPFF